MYCRLSSHCLILPQLNLNEVQYEAHIGIIADNLISMGNAISKQAKEANKSGP
jgi:hypothetical protein